MEAVVVTGPPEHLSFTQFPRERLSPMWTVDETPNCSVSSPGIVCFRPAGSSVCFVMLVPCLLLHRPSVSCC
jgi:hypothetical protein